MVALNNTPGDTPTTAAELMAAMREFSDVSRAGIVNWLRNLSKVQGMIEQALAFDGMRVICDEIQISLKHQLHEVRAHCDRLLTAEAAAQATTDTPPA